MALVQVFVLRIIIRIAVLTVYCSQYRPMHTYCMHVKIPPNTMRKSAKGANTIAGELLKYRQRPMHAHCIEVYCTVLSKYKLRPSFPSVFAVYCCK